MLQDIYTQLKTSAEKAIEHTKEELRTIRTGKPNPGMLENVSVSAYGGQMRLRELSTIASDSSNSLLIQPFDVSTTQAIETAIQASNLNLSARVEGNTIRVLFPPLTEDQRHQYSKVCATLIEDGKNKVRHAREEMRKDVKQLFDDKAITEDERYKAFEIIDKQTKEFTDHLDEIKKKKEEEIMTI